MARTPQFSIVETPKGWCVSVPPTMTASGKRKRKYYDTKTKAQALVAALKKQYNSGHRSGLISADLAADAMRAAEVLEGTGISLVEAARLAKTRLASVADKETFQARYDRMTAALEFQWSARYRTDMEKIQRWLPVEFFKRACGGIDREAIEEALQHKGPLARITLDRRSAMVLAVVRYRERHRKSSSSIHILTRNQQKAVLGACLDAGERRTVGLLLYAGIRPDVSHGEIRRLQWEDVGKTHIRIRPEASKTGSDRLIPICPALKSILEGHSATGPVTPLSWAKKWTRIRKTAGISHMQDVLRHTFASHFLMWKGEDACKSAMGHTAGSSTLFRHYRRAVTKEDSVKFFKESLED